jgi:DNA-binding CsgD family transcriptional regulator
VTVLAVVAPADGRRDSGAEDWPVHGRRLAGELRRRIACVLARSEALPECDPTVASAQVSQVLGFPAALGALDRAHARVGALLADAARQRGRPRVAELVDLLSEIERLRMELARARQSDQAERLADVHTALARLRAIRTVAEMMRLGPAELCRCGFDRATLSTVREPGWRIETCHVDGDPAWAQQIVRDGHAAWRGADPMSSESEMLRRRTPLCVRRAPDDASSPGALALPSARSFVAAPIMPEGRVIGFLHADCFVARRHVDDDDCAMLRLFAEGFGYALQRTVLLERMCSVRDDVDQMTRSIAAVADDACEAWARIGPLGAAERAKPDVRARSGASVCGQSRIESLLSRREVEVLELMAGGHTNAAIATHLTISEGTVKSHVKHILRKTRAANRAEAVFRFTRIAAKDGAPVTMR